MFSKTVEQKLDLFLRDCLTADRQIEEKDLQEHEMALRHSVWNLT